MKLKNTLQKGSVRYIVFKENDKWYAVGLEFNIVEVGEDPREALLSLFEGLQGYVNSARKMKARPNILNQKTDKEYETLWTALQKESAGTARKKLPLVYTFGQRDLSAVAG